MKDWSTVWTRCQWQVLELDATLIEAEETENEVTPSTSGNTGLKRMSALNPPDRH